MRDEDDVKKYKNNNNISSSKIGDKWKIEYFNNDELKDSKIALDEHTTRLSVVEMALAEQQSETK